MSDARITVGIPAYNAAPFIDRCVRSALAEVGDRGEVVVLDDASTDDTAGLVARIDDPRLRLHRHPENIGRVENVKAALEVGDGDFVALLPADCALPPGSLTRRAMALVEHPDASFAYGSVELCNADDDVIGTRRFVDTPTRTPLTASGPFLPSNQVFLSACLVRRAAYHSVDGLRIDVAPTHRDWDLLLRLALRAAPVAVPEVVAVERVHDGNVTAELERDDRIVTAELLVLEAVRRWSETEAPASLPVVEDAIDRWAMRRVAHALLAVAGFTPSSPERALGCALVANPRLSHGARYLGALTLTALPRRAVRPVLHAALGPADRRRRARWNLPQNPSSSRTGVAQRSTP